MLEKSFALLYFLKQSKTGGSKKYIYLRITVDGHPVEVSTKKQWFENRWDQDNGRASGTKPDAQELNFFLGTLENKVFQARKKLIEDDDLITAEALRDLVTGKDTRKMILEVFADHNRQMEALVGKDYADGTLERYETSLEHTKAFIQWQYLVNDLYIRKLDYFFIKQYAFWLVAVELIPSYCIHFHERSRVIAEIIF